MLANVQKRFMDIGQVLIERRTRAADFSADFIDFERCVHAHMLAEAEIGVGHEPLQHIPVGVLRAFAPVCSVQVLVFDPVLKTNGKVA